MSTDNILTHFIAGYPSLEESLKVGRGLLDGGAFALEMQIPYSDPSADGPVIENACRLALKGGFKADEAFKMIRTLKSEYKAPIFLMSYSGVVFARGVEGFVKQAKATGVDGLIIPDLTVGNDEELYALGKKHDIAVIPVIIPTVSQERVDEILAVKPQWIYVALRRGITGSKTDIGEEQIAFLEKLRGNGSKIMAGFGIQERDQVVALREHCDAVIVGSQVIRTIDSAVSGKNSAKEAVKELVKELSGCE